jgi:LmbE family N-acetylglucosaminyl deacetylase
MSFVGNKKVLVVTSHQDDESLFCGGLLTTLGESSPATVICMSEAKHKRNHDIRDNCFKNACRLVNARAITTTFREARHVWSNVDLFFRRRPEQIAAMVKFLEEQAAAIQPDVVITHNEAGEYGHCYHKVVHRVCRRVFSGKNLYCIARGSRLANGEILEVGYDREKKKQLMDCYPNFEAHGFSMRFFGCDMVYQPETFFAVGKDAPESKPPSRLKIYADVTADFLHFWNRKLRAKVKWY